MKKLLVLILVLGMASMANAALVTTVDGSEVAYGDDVLAGMLGMETKTAIPGFDIEVTAAGDVEMDVSAISYPIVWELPSYLVGEPTPTNIRITGSQIFGADKGPGGLFVDVAFTGVAGTLSFYDWMTGTKVLLGSLNVVPEPMTIALLGLGGLFLLRRRK